MALVITTKMNKDDDDDNDEKEEKDHRKGYLMMEMFPQNTATRIFAQEKYQKWEYQKPYLLNVMENIQQLLEKGNTAMTDLKPDNTLYDTDTRNATIIDLDGSVKVANQEELSKFDLKKYPFQSTPDFRAPELGRKEGVINMHKALAYSCGKVIEAITRNSDYKQQLETSQLIQKLTDLEPELRLSIRDAIITIKEIGDDSYIKDSICSHYINKVKDRLENKKSAISINEDIDRTRELYITLNATSLNPLIYRNIETEDLFQKIDEFLTPDNLNQVLAIFGVAGSGKSIALQLKFIEAVQAWQPGRPLPIYFNLANGIEIDHILNTLNNELGTALRPENLDKSHLYIDSFDEGFGIEHRRMELIKEYFQKLGSSKILITCRTDYLKDGWENWFSPESKKLEIRYVTPINYDGHKNLQPMGEKYVSYYQQQGYLKKTTNDYLTRLKELQLMDLIDTGFMFFLVLEVLFTLKQKNLRRINKLDIYTHYADFYQSNQISKLNDQQKKKLKETLHPRQDKDNLDLGLEVTEFGKFLACQLYLRGQVRLDHSHKIFAALKFDRSHLLKHQSINQIFKLLP
ncbi:MAG: hypothetical protein ACQUHE_17770, partial [Bacteroidia bacterium]